MFETVVPPTVVRPSRRVFYETLPVSLAVHALAVGGLLLSSVWTVAFPSQSPRITVAYSLTKIPDPPPPPPPPVQQPVAAPKVQAPKTAAAPPPPTEIVAPTVIPDFIPQLAEAAPAPPPPPPEAPPVAAPPPQAVAGGTPKGDANGLLGGSKFGVAGGIVFAEDGRVHVDRKEKLPLKVVEQDFPHYPDAARKDRLEDSLVVRYVIGTNGRVSDVAIIEHAKNAMFEPETLYVIRHWRFRPLMINGKPVEVVHEVEVFYQFIAR